MRNLRSTLSPLRLAFALLPLSLGLGQAQQLLYTLPTSSVVYRDNTSSANGASFTVGSSPVLVSHLGFFSTNTVSGLKSHQLVD